MIERLDGNIESLSANVIKYHTENNVKYVPQPSLPLHQQSSSTIISHGMVPSMSLPASVIPYTQPPPPPPNIPSHSYLMPPPPPPHPTSKSESTLKKIEPSVKTVQDKSRISSHDDNRHKNKTLIQQTLENVRNIGKVSIGL